jgi:hypothetical protein
MMSALALLIDNFASGGASIEALSEAEQELQVTLPDSYRSFMLASDGCDGPIGQLWLILYSIADVPRLTTQHRSATGVSDVVFIGTDGGGEACVIDYSGATPRFGSLRFIGDGLADLSHAAETLDAFVEELAGA